MILGKLTSLAVVWGIMMNILHPLSHTMTLDASHPENGVVAIVLSVSGPSVTLVATSRDHDKKVVHHQEDLGDGHCDVCHISVTAFILTSVMSGFMFQVSEEQSDLFVIPENGPSLRLDQPPQSLA